MSSAKTLKQSGNIKQNKPAQGKRSTKKSQVTENENEIRLRQKIETIMNVLCENDSRLYGPALDSLINLVRPSVSSLASLPLALKALLPFYQQLKLIYEKIRQDDVRRTLADIISVVSTIQPKSEALKYKLLGTKAKDLGFWGHDYLVHLSEEIVSEWSPKNETKLMPLVREITSYLLKQNAIAPGTDLLIELKKLDLMTEVVTAEETAQKACRYLRDTSCYLEPPDDTIALEVCFKLYMKFHMFVEATMIALQLENTALLKTVVSSCKDKSVSNQIALIVAKQQRHSLEVPELNPLVSNQKLHVLFQALGKELGISKPKHPLEVVFPRGSQRTTSEEVDYIANSLGNAESSFINAMVNCAFSSDLVLTGFNDEEWLYRTNGSDLQTVVVATLGLIYLWDVENGLAKVQKYLTSMNKRHRAGGVLASLVMSSGIRLHPDPCMEIATTHLSSEETEVKIATLVGLGICYVATNRHDVLQMLTPFLRTPINMENKLLIATAAVSSGLVAVGSGDIELIRLMYSLLTDMDINCTRIENDFTSWLVILGICLCCLGRLDREQTVTTLISTLSNKKLREMTTTLLDAFLYFKTGDVLKIQELLLICSKRVTPPPPSPSFMPGRRKGAKGKVSAARSKSSPFDHDPILEMLRRSFISAQDMTRRPVLVRQKQSSNSVSSSIISRASSPAVGEKSQAPPNSVPQQRPKIIPSNATMRDLLNARVNPPLADIMALTKIGTHADQPFLMAKKNPPSQPFSDLQSNLTTQPQQTPKTSSASSIGERPKASTSSVESPPPTLPPSSSSSSSLSPPPPRPPPPPPPPPSPPAATAGPKSSPAPRPLTGPPSSRLGIKQQMKGKTIPKTLGKRQPPLLSFQTSMNRTRSISPNRSRVPAIHRKFPKGASRMRSPPIGGLTTRRLSASRGARLVFNNFKSIITLSPIALQQAVATLGVGLLAFEEEVGRQMAIRVCGYFLRYGDGAVRRMAPLTLSLLFVSNPHQKIVEMLKKYSFDKDIETACNSIIALGLIGAGTNNLKIIRYLRDYAYVCKKYPICVTAARIALGFLNMGKGTLTMSPLKFDKQLLFTPSVASLMTVFFCCMDIRSTLLGKVPYLIYYITPAIQPKMLMTLDEKLDMIQTTARVGQSVDITGKVGKPKLLINGRTLNTPLLLATDERAELMSEQYTPLSPIVEDCVIVRKKQSST